MAGRILFPFARGDRLRAEAAQLVVQGDDAKLDEWLSADVERATAYLEGAFLWNDLKGVPAATAPSVPAFSANRRYFVAAAAAAAVVVAAIGLPLVSGTGEIVHRTAVGEQRVVTLADGSRATLNTDTVLEVAYTAERRGMRLVRGEALFEVAHDPNYPFLVEAGGGTVRALGTAFVVRSERDRLEVTLITGRVEVSRQTGAARRVVELSPGERYSSDGDAGPVKLDKPRVEAVIAWRNGQLIFDETPLAEAVAEANRYEIQPIELRVTGDPATLSGVFRTGENHNFARSVATMYGLQIDEAPSGIVISGRINTR
ncbi:FecR family protein [Sphingomonas hengshuiensis]|uniref:FecR family protein n=1 Tax=Sphingomonas hengshuiensis TaxID=1609977 RepID=UPI0005C8AE29|nr:FecR domain-containing protein [Sphingomonas hengshuiensis]